MKGQGLLVALLQVTLQWQKSPEGVRAGVLQLSNPRAVCCDAVLSQHMLCCAPTLSSEGKLRHRSYEAPLLILELVRGGSASAPKNFRPSSSFFLHHLEIH